MSQKHCTLEQKHQDDACIEQEKDNQDAAQAHAIKRVANILISESKAEKNLVMKHWHPRPRLAPSQVQTSVTNIGM